LPAFVAGQAERVKPSNITLNKLRCGRTKIVSIIPHRTKRSDGNNNGITKILSDKTPHPESGNGIPGCELYLIVDDIQLEFENADKSGAKLIRPIIDRDLETKFAASLTRTVI
jgi:hypothetical protein